MRRRELVSTADGRDEAMTSEITVREGAQHAVWTIEQRALIRMTFASGATDGEFAALLAVAESRNLNPFTKQVYFVKRWDSQKRSETWAVQVSIDGLRAIAERTGLYAGQDEPEYEYEENGTIRLCRVRVYRKDWGGRACVGVAHWREYVQLSREAKPNAMWAKYAHIMIAKCAEALALRKAFPEAASGLYTTEEIPIEQPQRVDVVRSDEPEARASAAIDREIAESIAEAKYQSGLTTPQAPAADGRDPRTTPSFQRLLDALEKAVDTGSVVGAWIAHSHELVQEGSDVLREGQEQLRKAWAAFGGEKGALTKSIEAAREAADAPAPDAKSRSKSRKSAAAPLTRTIEAPTPAEWDAQVSHDTNAGHIAGGFHKRSLLWRERGELARVRAITVDRLCALLGRDECDASAWLDGCAPARRSERRHAESKRTSLQ